MAQRWTILQAKHHKKILEDLYIKQNLTIKEIGDQLGLKHNSIFTRLQRFNIPSIRSKKKGYNNKQFIVKPKESAMLAELCGIILGDGSIKTKGQLVITVNHRDDEQYIGYVEKILGNLFGVRVGHSVREEDHTTDLFVGSVDVIQYLQTLGIWSSNKVRDQVDAPVWIKNNPSYFPGFIRGFFDTDGSIYKLKSGSIQMSFTNNALPLLQSLRIILEALGYSPSRGVTRFYITKKRDIQRYIETIGFGNQKHLIRAQKFGII